MFITSRVVAIAREPVKFLNNDSVENAFRAVFNHSLKFWTVVGFSRICAVDIVSDDFYMVKLCVSITLAQLPVIDSSR